MTLERVLTHSKSLIKQCTQAGDIVIDATCGNGLDTLFLAKLVGPTGLVHGFDIQEHALIKTRELLKHHECFQVKLHHIGHQHLKQTIPIEQHGHISSVLFNLGYLPKSDHSITTTGETTLQAVKDALEVVKVNGLIVLVVYTGHDEGVKEEWVLSQFLSQLDQKQAMVLQYRFMNQRNHAPYIIAIEKLK
jgi:predicted methyltransferase